MNIGIIGSADGPTSILLSLGSNSYFIISFIIICIALIGIVIWNKRRKKR